MGGAVAFCGTGLEEVNVDGMEDGRCFLSPVSGPDIGSPLFAVALLAFGVASTIIATLAAQIVDAAA